MRDDDPPLEVARWLVTEGLDVIERCVAALAEGQDALQVGTALRSEIPARFAAPAVTAAAERLAARARGDVQADALVLTRETAQQRSRPVVAAHRALRAAGAQTVVDVCAGAGTDACALATVAGSAVAVELQPGRAVLAAHHATALSAPVAVVAADALRLPLRLAGCLVHADPSRRTATGRAGRLAATTPAVPQLLGSLHEAAGVACTVAPGLDWSDPDLPPDAEVEFVQVGQDLVEATIWTGAWRRQGTVATATLLPAGLQRSRTVAARPLPVSPIDAVLLEVAPAAVRARVHDALGAEVGASRIAHTRALLTAPDAVHSPWWRTWRVEAVLPARPRAVRRWLDGADELPLEVSLHGLEADLTAWWRALGHPLRGPQGRRLHLVRTDDGSVCVVTVDALSTSTSPWPRS